MPEVVRKHVVELRRDGLIETKSKRNGAALYRVVAEPTERPRSAVRTKADKVLDALADPTIREELRTQVAESKKERGILATLRAWDEEDLKRQAAEDREALRLRNVELNAIGKTSDYWATLRKLFETTTTVLAAYVRDFDYLPPPEDYQLRLAEGAIHNFDDVMAKLRAKLRPQDDDARTVIEVDGSG